MSKLKSLLNEIEAVMASGFYENIDEIMHGLDSAMIFLNNSSTEDNETLTKLLQLIYSTMVGLGSSKAYEFSDYASNGVRMYRNALNYIMSHYLTQFKDSPDTLLKYLKKELSITYKAQEKAAIHNKIEKLLI